MTTDNSSMVYNATLLDMISCLSNAIDLIHPIFADHHKRVAYLSNEIALQLGLDHRVRSDTIAAALVHDCGVPCVHKRYDLLVLFEDHSSIHSEMGYHFLKEFCCERTGIPTVNTTFCLILKYLNVSRWSPTFNHLATIFFSAAD